MIETNRYMDQKHKLSTCYKVAHRAFQLGLQQQQRRHLLIKMNVSTSLRGFLGSSSLEKVIFL